MITISTIITESQKFAFEVFYDNRRLKISLTSNGVLRECCRLVCHRTDRLKKYGTPKGWGMGTGMVIGKHLELLVTVKGGVVVVR